MHRSWIVLGLIILLSPTTARCADRPKVIRWDFGTEETTPLRAHGGVHRDAPGPRPPIYPDFDSTNTAIKLDGSGAHLSFEDSGPESQFDFTSGDAITLEAWVQVDQLRGGDNVYVIGKGRTGSPGFAADNQNWALRVRETKGKAGLSFLFATPVPSGATRNGSHWHRWTTKSGFKPGKGWHHIAVAYQFGQPGSIRGWIDGQLQEGTWDMGGPTEQAPVVDDDEVWIGSSQGGAASSSFRGSLDAIAIHRQALDDAVMKK
ncbi:MAG: LamG-like jellyroll fold domain-containing protein, partial [Aureliella sp.]